MTAQVLATAFGPLDWTVLGAYLLAVVAIGSWFSRREKSTDDYFLAGRRIPWWAAGLSIFGTALSAITYMAVPGSAYKGDWVMILASLSPVLVVPIVTGFYIPFFRRLNITTAYEYLQRRFNTPVRLLASTVWILFQFGRMAIVLYLPSLALAAVTGINLYACILLMGVLCTVYTYLGGMEAVIWTDVLQVIVLMGGAVLCLVLIVLKVEGGVGAIVSQGLAAGKFHTFNATLSWSAAAVWVIALGGAVNNFSVYTTDQALVQRYLSTRTEKQARQAVWTSALAGVPTALLFFSLGTALFVFYEQHPQLLGQIVRDNSDAVLPFFIMQQLPTGVSGLLIAGLFAAAMSSIDSSMNSVSAAVTTDFFRRFRPRASEHACLLLAKNLTLAIGVVGTAGALLLARCNIRSQYEFFLMVLGLFTGGLAGVFALGIFTRRAHGTGALCGAGVSVAVLATLQACKDLLPVHGMLLGCIGLAVCVVVGYAASLLLPAPRKDLAGLTVHTLPKEQ
ncbi:MAG TPA: sodium:solute symporter [Phycisphaerae bacterium]|nr:sodium:solute symporter [Phycisphaerae bacterium]